MAPVLKAFGIPVRIEPVFLIVVALIGAAGGGDIGEVLIWIPVVLVSVLWHELGHAFLVRLYGRSPRIVLHGFGGTTSWQAGPGFSPGRHIAVSLAGPFFGFLLGGLTYGLAQWQAEVVASSRFAQVLVRDLLWVNVGWGVLNLLPILPLDGGNVMRSVLDRFTGGHGDRPAKLVSFILAVLLAGLALTQRWIWGAFLVGWIAADNYRAWRATREARTGAGAGPLWLEATEAVRREDPAAAREIARKMDELAASGDADARALSPVLRAWSSRLVGENRAAEAAWNEADRDVRDLPAAQGWLHLASGEPDAAARVLREGFDAAPDRGADAGLATALARSGRLDEALALADTRPEAVGPWYLRALQNEAFDARRWADAVRIGTVLHEQTGDPVAAYDVACALVHLDRPAEAVGWLQTARRAGWLDRETLEQDRDLAPLRGRPDFESLRDEL